MKFSVVFMGLLALCSTSSTRNSSDSDEYAIADQDYLTKYQLILQLFEHINQPNYNEAISEIAKSYDIGKNINNYEKLAAVEQFLGKYQEGFLPQGEIFSAFYQEQMKESRNLVYLLYYAKDFVTFYKTACWAKLYLNEGLFLFALSVVVAIRDDCRLFNIPPIYEINPHFFFNSEAIQKASDLKQKYCGKNADYPREDDGFEGFTVNANYSGFYLNLHPEQSLSYFMEDVGWNAFYFYQNIHYPFWLPGLENGKTRDFLYRRGERFFFHTQQILARYYAERLANKFGPIPEFEWDLPFETGYHPSLRYPTGLEFPTRPNFANLREFFFNYGQKPTTSRTYRRAYTYVQDNFRRLRDLIDYGVYTFVKGGAPIDLMNEGGIEILGNIIDSNLESPNVRLFGHIQVYSRHILGFSTQPKDKYQAIPASLQHYETSLRDPAFYQLYKQIYYLFELYKQYLPPYKVGDLLFPGVAVKKVEFDDLKTHFDFFYSDISNAVYMSPEEVGSTKFKVRAKQYRLNHKPFNYKIYVESEKPFQASVRVYLGPKLDEYGRNIGMIENRVNFVQLDYFVYNLTAGENIMERSDDQLFGYCDDQMSYKDLYNKVLAAREGKDVFKIQPKLLCFPRRLVLPKGSLLGTPYKIYVIVSPYKPAKQGRSYNDIYQYPVYRVDDYALGYPFDRVIYDPSGYAVPNAYWYETKIYHDESEVKYPPF